VDALLRENMGRCEILQEVHPELCFYFMNRERPMSWPKRSAEGQLERVGLLRAWCGTTIDDALARRRDMGCAADDIVDAFAAQWTAERVARNEAVTVPLVPPRDRLGLRMEIGA